MARNQVIEALLELHRVDTEVDRIKSQEELLPLSLRRIETRLARQRKLIDEKKHQIEGLRAQNRARDLELRSQEEDIGKLTGQIRKVRTNKEYQTLQHEISTKKVDASRIEDAILTLMADIEIVEKEIKELAGSTTQIEREMKEEMKLVQEETDRLQARRAELEAKRAGSASGVDAELLGEYERIAAKKGASAIATVVGRTCQGCFMQVPPQLEQELMAGIRLTRCPSCSRILYLP